MKWFRRCQHEVLADTAAKTAKSDNDLRDTKDALQGSLARWKSAQRQLDALLAGISIDDSVSKLADNLNGKSKRA